MYSHQWGYYMDSVYWEVIGDDFEILYSPKNANVREIPMQATVSPQGAAIINVPLELPDIGSGLQPDLAFFYNSMKPVSMFGNDWGLSGLSEIRRTGKSIYYDGVKAGVDEKAAIDGSEVFTLNGQRLIVIRNNYPESVEYKSETGNIKVKARIAQRNDSLTGRKPMYVYRNFEVSYPNGKTVVFGYEDMYDNESLVEFPITRITDRLGNNIYYDYFYKYGEYHIDRIRFGKTGEAEVHFQYEQTKIPFKKKTFLDEPYQMFQMSLSVIKPEDPKHDMDANCILKTVSIRYNNHDFRDYSFQYRSDGRYIFLTEIHMTKNKTGSTASVSSLPGLFPEYTVLENDTADFAMPIRFRYGENQSPDIDKKTEKLNYTYPEAASRKGMFGGKQTSGIIIYPRIKMHQNESCDENDRIIIKPDINTSQTLNLTAGKGFVEVLCVDLDNNTGDEIVRVNNYISNGRDVIEFAVYTFNAAGNLTHLYTKKYNTAFPVNNNTLAEKEFFTGDFDGDGKNEILVVSSMRSNKIVPFAEMYSMDNEYAIYQDEIFKNIGVKVVPPIHDDPVNIEYFKSFLIQGDFNGDGKVDFFYQPIANKFAAFMEFVKEDGVIKPVRTGEDLDMRYVQNCYYLAGDFNGDGRTDLYPSGYDWIYLSDGTNLVHQSIYLDKLPGYYDIISTEDMNGDGQSDLTIIKGNRTSIYLFSMGKIVAMADSVIGVNDSYSLAARSYTGEEIGKNDLVLVGNNELVRLSYGIDLSKALLITGVKSSLGVLTNFSYSMINEADIYSSTTSAPFPYQNLPRTATVVSKMRTRVNKTIVEAKDYHYENGIIHKQGLGFCGFEKVSVLDSIRNHSVVSVFDPYNFGVLKSSESPVQKTVNNYTINVAANKTAEIRLAKSTQTNKLKGNSLTASYLYDIYGNVNKETLDYGSGLKKVTDNVYDNYNLASLYCLGELKTQTIYHYNGAGSASNKVSITYNDKGLPQNKKLYYNNLQTLEEITPFDNAGNLLSLGVKPYSAAALTKSYEYDAAGRVIKETDPTGLSVCSVYNGKGQLVSSTDIYGNHTEYEYDAFGQLIKTISPTGAISTLEYKWENLPGFNLGILGGITPTNTAYSFTTRVENAAGTLLEPESMVFFDGLGHEIRSAEKRFDGKWLIVDKVYDARGRLQKVSLPYNPDPYLEPEPGPGPGIEIPGGILPAAGVNLFWDVYTYDDYDRLTAITYASGKKDSWSYSGNTETSTIDGITTKRTYNAAGQLIKVEDPGGTIIYTYRPDGQQSSINVNGVVTTFTYDNYGRQTAINDPSAGLEQYEYDSAGNLKKHTDALNNTTTLQYDSYQRVIRKELPEFSTTYAYNTYGGLASEISTNGTSAVYTYDGYGRPKTVQENATANVWLKKEYNYSEANISSVIYSTEKQTLTTEYFIYTNGHLTERKYDDAITGLIPPGPPVITPPWIQEPFPGVGSSALEPIDPLFVKTFWKLNSVNDMGQPAKVTTGKLSREYSYSSYGLPTGRKVKKDTQALLDHTYSFAHSTGNLNYRKDNIHNTTENFTYDNADRLIAINHTPAGGAAFQRNIQYQSNGNIDEISDVGYFAYSPDKPYQLTSAYLHEAQEAVQYGVSHSISYTSFKRPEQIIQDGYTSNFTYNANGDRVKMLTYHIHDGEQEERYYLGGQYERGIKDELLYLGGDAYSAPAVLRKGSDGWWKFYYICRDYLGSICLITDEAGKAVAEYSYDAWGRLRNPATLEIYEAGEEPSLFLGRGYTGHEHLPHYGLINMNARLYYPVVGRFLSPDPYVQNTENTQNYNRYSYALNNPLKYTDPSGEISYKTDDPTLWAALLWHLATGGSVNNFEPYGWETLGDNGELLGMYGYDSATGSGYSFSTGYDRYAGVRRVILPDNSIYMFSINANLTQYKTLKNHAMDWFYSTSLEGTYNGWDYAKFAAGAIGFEVGVLEAGWNYSSKAVKNQTAYNIQQTLKTHGVKVQTKAIKSGVSKILRGGGRATGYLSIGFTTADMVLNSQVNASNLVDVAVTGVAFIPVVGWAISGSYFIADIITLGITGESIGGHINNAVGKPLLKW